VSLKVVPKPAFDLENCSESHEYALETMTYESKGKPEQKFDAAFGKTLESVRVFKESSKKVQLIFLLN
jgi:hypothetical protein